MGMETTRAAYSALAQRYIDAFGGSPRERASDVAFVERHLVGLDGPVLDLGCGPGQWTAHLHALGVDVAGVDVVPEFIDHARATHPGPAFHLRSMTAIDAPDHSVAGVLAWFSTIHVPPARLGAVLVGFHRLLVPGGTLVLGVFDSPDGVEPFDHAVTTAYRWPADALADQLVRAGFAVVEQQSHAVPDRPDRRHAAVAARASSRAGRAQPAP